MNERARRAAALQAAVHRDGRGDRRARFAQRLAEVEAARRRDRRRRRGLLALGAVAVLAAGAGIGAFLVAPSVGDAGSDGWLVGVAVGLAGAVAVLAVAALLRRLAAARGARAWDWRAQRHVLLGDPSAEVQAADGRSGERRT